MKYLLLCLDTLLFKQDVFCFYIKENTFWDSNQQALFKYIEQHTSEKIVIVDATKLSKVTAYWQLIRSKVIIFDHSLPHFLISKKHIRVNLWHGTPLKKIRFHLSKQSQLSLANHQAKITDILCSNSNYDALLMSSAMHIPRYNVLDTGLPRNDYLTCSIKELNNIDIYEDYTALLKVKSTFSKVITWAPTFRGEFKNPVEPIQLTQLEQKSICTFLEKHNICLWLRMHKFSQFTELQTLFSHPNVFNVTKIINSNIVLRLSDVLITDYSSIWIDYLLISKPIILFAKDYEQYLDDHGFMLDFDQQIPVPFLNNVKELMFALDKAVHNEAFNGYQESLSKYHHHNVSINKSKLVYQAIKSFKRM